MSQDFIITSKTNNQFKYSNNFDEIKLKIYVYKPSINQRGSILRSIVILYMSSICAV